MNEINKKKYSQRTNIFYRKFWLKYNRLYERNWLEWAIWLHNSYRLQYCNNVETSKEGNACDHYY